MRKESYQILPLILIVVILLIQLGPSSDLKITPTVLMSENSNECLTFQNVTNDYNYSGPPQNSFNITAELSNHCAEEILYPSTLILNNTQGVNVSSDQVNWHYGIDGDSSYQVIWEVTRDSTIAEGTFVTFELHPTRDNCFENCTKSQNYSYNYTIPFGLVDLNSCYTIENMTDDYVLGVNTFNITAELNNSCRGGIHYPVGILLDYNHTGVISSPGSGVVNYGAFAYMIFENTSTTIQWGFTINYTMMANETDEGYSGSCPLSHPYPSDPAGAGDDNDTSNWCCPNPYVEEWNECYPTQDDIPCPSGGPCRQFGTDIVLAFQPDCDVYTASSFIAHYYMQDCDLTTFDTVNYIKLIGEPPVPDNETGNTTIIDDETGNTTISDNETGNTTIPGAESELSNNSTDEGNENNPIKEEETNDDTEAGLVPGFGSVLGVITLLVASIYRRFR